MFSLSIYDTLRNIIGIMLFQRYPLFGSVWVIVKWILYCLLQNLVLHKTIMISFCRCMEQNDMLMKYRIVMYMENYYHILVMFFHIFNSMVFWRCFVLNWPFLSSNRMFFNIQSYKSWDARKGKVMAIYVHYFFQFWFRFYNSLSFNLS